MVEIIYRFQSHHHLQTLHHHLPRHHFEIRRAAKLYHPNVVAIKGCCYDHEDRFIVYEFIASGLLDRWLHLVPKCGRSLNWNMRFLHDKVTKFFIIIYIFLMLLKDYSILIIKIQKCCYYAKKKCFTKSMFCND